MHSRNLGHFDVEIAKGGGAFVCGESTALIASIEGRVGEPRSKQIRTVKQGLWGKPTNLNNVETWANVPVIINQGADWYAQIGTEGSKGTKIFSLVGKVNNTGHDSIISSDDADLYYGDPSHKKVSKRKRKENKIDLVISDIRMPDINGLDLLVRIKKEHPQTKIIIMTAYGSTETAIEAMKEGAPLVHEDRPGNICVEYHWNFCRDLCVAVHHCTGHCCCGLLCRVFVHGIHEGKGTHKRRVRQVVSSLSACIGHDADLVWFAPPPKRPLH
jgi:CheY-like chemotaxis protein